MDLSANPHLKAREQWDEGLTLNGWVNCKIKHEEIQNMDLWGGEGEINDQMREMESSPLIISILL
jgi:hypothetical protein